MLPQERSKMLVASAPLHYFEDYLSSRECDPAVLAQPRRGTFLALRARPVQKRRFSNWDVLSIQVFNHRPGIHILLSMLALGDYFNPLQDLQTDRRPHSLFSTAQPSAQSDSDAHQSGTGTSALAAHQARSLSSQNVPSTVLTPLFQPVNPAY